MLNYNSTLLFSSNPKDLSKFYEKVFDKKPDMTDGDYFGFSVGNGFFTIGPHDKVHGKNAQPERIIFNFETENVQQEALRIKDLGAKVIAEPYQMGEDNQAWIATFADPDENYFQLMSPWDNGKN